MERNNNIDISVEINKIKSILYDLEVSRKNIEVITKSLESVKEEGGSVTLDIFPVGGDGGSNTELSGEDSERCVSALIGSYNDQVSAAKRDITVILNSLVFREVNLRDKTKNSGAGYHE